MTKTIKSTNTNGYHIYMEYNFCGYPFIEVGACPIHKDGTCGYPLNKMTYCIDDGANAKRTYSRYVRKYRDM